MAKKKVNNDEAVLRGRADKLLAELREMAADVENIEKEYAAEIARLADLRGERMAELLSRVTDAERDLSRMMKANRDVFFAVGDTCPLNHGTLIHAEGSKVIIHGKMDAVIALAEAAGLNEVVKIEKSLDRDLINKWPDEQLAVIGAERKKTETFKYDLKSK